jgi:hypothetical protein
MRKLVPGILFLLVGSSALLVSCKDDSDGAGPDVVLRTDGFLCTMGIDTQGHEDTLTSTLQDHFTFTSKQKEFFFMER